MARAKSARDNGTGCIKRGAENGRRVMTRPLNPALFRYLRSVQHSDRVGVHGYFRRNPDALASPRSVYRWQRSLGDQLHVFPNVRAERLGLRHAHVFITQPGPGWLSCPFAIEAAWVTPDFCTEVLYLHCLVPDGVVFATFKLFPCASAAVVWSESAWQQFLVDDEPITLPVRTGVLDASVLRESPFLVPAVAEMHHYPNSLPLAWHRIHQSLGGRLRQFLPRTRIRYVNGKNHLTKAFALLKERGIFVQHLIRYHPLLAQSVEVFVRAQMERDALTALLERLRVVLHAVETYPTEDGYWCRLLGPHRLLDAIMHLPAEARACLSGVHFHTKRHPSPVVRFQYESLFEPTTGTWRTT